MVNMHKMKGRNYIFDLIFLYCYIMSVSYRTKKCHIIINLTGGTEKDLQRKGRNQDG